MVQEELDLGVVTEGRVGPKTKEAIRNLEGNLPQVRRVMGGKVRTQAVSSLPVVRLRVRVIWTEVSHEWANMSVEVLIQGRWEKLQGSPLAVARRYSGSQGDVEAPAITAVALAKHLLSEGGVEVVEMFGEEHRQSGEALGVYAWYWWADLSAPISVAVRKDIAGDVRLEAI